MRSEVLAPYTVLDLTRVRSGPTCVRQLADWGADVVKIEAPGADSAGSLGGPRDGSDFQNLQRNKRSIALDLKTDGGRATFLQMAAGADVVVENFRPGVTARLGIDYEQLRLLNPRLVYASISGYGQTGPLADRPGFDQVAQGLGGLMSVTGEPGRGPMRAGIPVADLTAGLLCAQGVLLALLERERSGLGQWVQTSLLQAQVFMLDFQAARWLVDGEVAGQAGNDHPTSIPTGVFRTSDGHINIASSGQTIWLRLKAVLGDPRLNDDAFADGPARSTNRRALNDIIEAVTKRDTSAAWIERLNAAGVPCGAINTIDKVFAEPQVRHLGMAAPVTSHERGEIELVGQPIVLSRTPWKMDRPPPRYGEHTREVLEQFGILQPESDS
ncbi:MAG: CaiB/BaiF CoA transferase family protein [Acidimicrobiia bacterium]